MSQQTAREQQSPPPRDAIFLSHANPEDNAFTLWLGAKLAAMGYEVWADVIRLHGGSDWSRDLERALRARAAKVLVICTPQAVQKQGVRNEIEMATRVSAEIGDSEFIVPLKLAAFDAPFRIAHSQYVDFSKDWGLGLAELVELLQSVFKLPRRAEASAAQWLSAQARGAARLVRTRERLNSNWLRLNRMPKLLHYVEPPSGFPAELFQAKGRHRWPVVPHKAGVVTFTRPRTGELSNGLPGREVESIHVRRFLDEGWSELSITPDEARRQFSDLSNQALETFLRGRGLSSAASSGGRLVWWGNIRTAPLTQVPFNWPQQKGRRQIIGQSEKRGVHWHFAIAGQMRTAPVRHLRISSKLVFSENGMDAIDDISRLHRLRRSLVKSWRNARWRDMLSAYLWWLADGKDLLALPVDDYESLVLELPPAAFLSPVSILHDGDDPPDEDDPDVDLDHWGDEDDDVPDTSEPNS